MNVRRLAAVPVLVFASIAFAAPIFSVELKAMGPKKIAVIKVVKETTGLGLKESKELVEAAPKTVKTGLEEEAAKAIVARLVEAGATAIVVAAEAKEAAPAPPPGALSTVTLTQCGDRKIEIIKIVRTATGLGLKEAKDLVEKTPAVVKKGMPSADADALANLLQFAGGTAKVTAD
jgi:large subunit ribosomal protein L7/L12